MATTQQTTQEEVINHYLFNLDRPGLIQLCQQALMTKDYNWQSTKELILDRVEEYNIFYPRGY